MTSRFTEPFIFKFKPTAKVQSAAKGWGPERPAPGLKMAKPPAESGTEQASAEKPKFNFGGLGGFGRGTGFAAAAFTKHEPGESAAGTAQAPRPPGAWRSGQKRGAAAAAAPAAEATAEAAAPVAQGAWSLGQ
jgi:hypothetical protein